MLANRNSLLGVGVLFLCVFAASACSPLADGAPANGASDGGNDASSNGTTDGGETSDSAGGGNDTGIGADSGQDEDTGSGNVSDADTGDVTPGFPDTGTADAGSDAGPFPGCGTFGTFAPVLLFDQWVWSGWEPSAKIGLTPDTCNLGDPLRPWEQVTPPAGAAGKCFVQHIDLQAQTTGWGAVAWYHWNPGDEGYPDQGQRIGNPKLLSICSAKTVSFQVQTDTEGLVITFAAGDPAYQAMSGPITLQANVWKQVTMPFSGWVQLPVARGFYWVVDYNQPALQGKTTFNFYLDDAKILP